MKGILLRFGVDMYKMLHKKEKHGCKAPFML